MPVPNYVQALLEVGAGRTGVDRSHERAFTADDGSANSRRRLNVDAVPAHCRWMRVQVVDADGKVLAVGRDWAALQAQRCAARRASVSQRCRPRNSSGVGLRDWDFGELPVAEVHFWPATAFSYGYPALVAEADGTLALRVLDSPARAEVATRAGLRRLIAWKLGWRSNNWRATCPIFSA
ncbi:MAG: DUF3418 domain-containing protein [Candidatus Competibacteraceae bacterium]